MARPKKEDNVLSSTTFAAPDAVQGLPVSGMPVPEPQGETLLAAILENLSDNKAEEVVQVDLRGKSSVCDFMVICSGRSSRQVAAIAQHLSEELKQTYGVATRSEGKDIGDWVLLDAGDVVVHVFRPEVREFYQLEKMWMPSASNVDTSAR